MDYLYLQSNTDLSKIKLDLSQFKGSKEYHNYIFKLFQHSNIYYVPSDILLNEKKEFFDFLTQVTTENNIEITLLVEEEEDDYIEYYDISFK